MKKLIAVLSVFIISLFSLAPSAFAVSFAASGEQVTLNRDEVVNHDYFAAGQSVTISGTVNGDAYLAGNNVTVDGTINGDLMIAGSNLDIRGTVKGDVRAGGSNITISGKVGGNLTVGGGKVYLADNSTLGGSIVAGAGDLTILTAVPKGITAGVGTMRLDKKVGGDVNYWSDQDVTLGSSATVSGTLTRHDVPKAEKKPAEVAAGAFTGAALGFKVIGTLGLFLIGIIFLSLAPLYATSVIGNIGKKPWISLLLGFAAMILMPIGALILLITVVGAPLALLVFLAFLVLSMFAKIIGALFLGSWMLSRFMKKANLYGALALGFVAFFVLALIPLVGWLTMAIIYLMAFGSLIAHHRELYLSLRTKKMI